MSSVQLGVKIFIKIDINWSIGGEGQSEDMNDLQNYRIRFKNSKILKSLKMVVKKDL